MGIRSLSLQEFDRLNSVRAVVRRHTETAVEWFIDDMGAVIGAIASHHLDLDWSVLVLARDHTGEFHRVHRCSGLSVLDDARHLLVNRMAIVLTTGSDGVARVNADAEEHGENQSPPAAA